MKNENQSNMQCYVLIILNASLFYHIIIKIRRKKGKMINLQYWFVCTDSTNNKCSNRFQKDENIDDQY